MKTRRQRIFGIIGKPVENDRVSRLFNVFIVNTLFLSMVPIVLESFQELVLR